MAVSFIAKHITLLKSTYFDRTSTSFGESLIAQEHIKRRILQLLYPNEQSITRDFKKLPIHNYKDIEFLLGQGKWFHGMPIKNLKAFATSSGTSSGGDPLSVKKIPITSDALAGSYKAMISMLASYICETGRNPYTHGLLSVVRPIDRKNIWHGQPLGYISGVLHHYASSITRIFNVFPEPFLVQVEREIDTGDVSSDHKMHKLVQYIHDQHHGKVGVLAGVPHWGLGLIEWYRKEYGEESLHEKFDIQLGIYGGGPTTVHRAHTKDIFSGAYFADAYNAGEGFFAIQDRNFADIDYHSMRLMTDIDIYYEFVAQDDYIHYYKNSTNPDLGDLNYKMIDLSKVEESKNYVLFISTTWGLVRYNMGDVIAFVDKDQLQILVKGRINGGCNHLNEHIEAPHIDAFIAANPQYGIVGYYCITQKLEDGKFQYLFCPIVKDAVVIDHSLLTKAFDESLQDQNPNYKKVRTSETLLTPDVCMIDEQKLVQYLSDSGKFVIGQTKIPHKVYDELFDDDHPLGEMLGNMVG